MVHVTPSPSPMSSPADQPASDPGRSSAVAAHVEQLYASHAALVRSVCRSLLRDRSEADDAVQQTFLSAQRALLNGSSPRDAAAWLATIARHESLARVRARMREPLPVEIEEHEAAGPDAHAAAVHRHEAASSAKPSLSYRPNSARRSCCARCAASRIRRSRPRLRSRLPRWSRCCSAPAGPSRRGCRRRSRQSHPSSRYGSSPRVSRAGAWQDPLPRRSRRWVSALPSRPAAHWSGRQSSDWVTPRRRRSARRRLLGIDQPPTPRRTRRSGLQPRHTRPASWPCSTHTSVSRPTAAMPAPAWRPPIGKARPTRVSTSLPPTPRARRPATDLPTRPPTAGRPRTAPATHATAGVTPARPTPRAPTPRATRQQPTRVRPTPRAIRRRRPTRARATDSHRRRAPSGPRGILPFARCRGR